MGVNGRFILLIKNPKVSILDDFFLTMELHESRLVGLKKIGTSIHNIALAVEPKLAKFDSSMDDDEQDFLVREMKKIFKANNFDRK